MHFVLFCADKLTELLPANCERLVSRNAVAALYRIMNICNRSEPHVRIVTFALNTLLNVAMVRTSQPPAQTQHAQLSRFFVAEREHA